MSRRSLATQIAAVSIGTAVLAAALAGALSVGLIKSSGTGAAQTKLARFADIAQTVARRGTAAGAESRVRAALNGLAVRVSTVNRNGVLLAPQRIVAQAVTDSDIAAVLAGHDVSRIGSARAGTVLIEGRPTSSGGVFAVQLKADAEAVEYRAIGRIAIASLIASGVAAMLGLTLAVRIARPLRRTAEAAHAMARGERGVSVAPEGPREVADVAESVNTLSSALDHSEARQREFLLSVSHDLRTPLTAISGYAESLADGVVAPQEAAEVAAIMLDEAKRLERLVGDLLDLARLDAADLSLDIADAAIGDIATGAAAAWAGRLHAAGIELRTESSAHPLNVMTDANRVRQAFDGLIENAFRVTPAGAPIVIATRAEEGWAVLEVRDGGPGLSDDDLVVAFDNGELFRRYRGLRRVGTGHGLAIVHRLVTRLGGTITAGHATEGGTSITIRLPLTDPAHPS